MLAPDNRHERRYHVKVDFRLLGDLSLLNANAVQYPDSYEITLLGHSKNISASGLALFIPSFTIDQRLSGDEKRML
jgi:hypothetical protein